MKYHIYLLICPITNKVRYVGQTKNPKTRYKSHLKDAHKIKKNGKTEKQQWILNLEERRLKPLIKVVFSCENPEKARKIEEKTVILYINTVFNIHMPGKGSKSVDHYRKTGELK